MNCSLPVSGNSVRVRKVDSNHADIRKAARSAGLSWIDLHRQGDGAPDAVVGCYGRTLLVELKSERGTESDAQREKREAWRGGPWIVARSLRDILDALMAGKA